MKKQEHRGKTAFLNYYREIFQDRLEDILACFEREEEKFPRCHGLDLDIKTSREINLEKALENKSRYQIYYLDYASLLVAYLLPLKSGGTILDMCAAPGGKSLVLIQRMDDHSKIELNEISPNRRERLKRVLSEYGEGDNNQIQVLGYDGIKFGIHRENQFDSILLDAPCSSEGHVYTSPKHLEQWTLKRPKQLAKKQYGLLCSAILSCKEGGHIVYSTCALTPIENDDVIERIVDKKGNQVEVVKIPKEIAKYGEKTKYGLRFLPDQSSLGPMYVCLLRKRIAD